MIGKRRRFSGAFKAQVVLEALREQKTVAEIAREQGIHPNIIAIWKRQMLDQLPDLFENPSPQKQDEKRVDELHKKIGQLTVEIDWLKKKSEQLIG